MYLNTSLNASQNGKHIPSLEKKKNDVGVVTHSNSILLERYNSQDMMHWYGRPLDPLDRTESTEVNPHIYGGFGFNKGAEASKWERGWSFQPMVLRRLDITDKKINLDTCFTPETKINSTWIMNLKVKPDTIKLLENRPKSLWSWSKQRFLRCNTQTMLHMRTHW